MLRLWDTVYTDRIPDSEVLTGDAALDPARENILHERLRRAGKQFGKYCVVGGIGFIINLIIFALLANVAHVHYQIAATISFTVAVTNNFLLNKYWTFENPEGNGLVQASRFLVISVMIWAINLLILHLLIENVHMNSKILAQAIAIVFVTVLNFTGNKMWSFRQTAA